MNLAIEQAPDSNIQHSYCKGSALYNQALECAIKSIVKCGPVYECRSNREGELIEETYEDELFENDELDDSELPF